MARITVIIDDIIKLSQGSITGEPKPSKVAALCDLAGAGGVLYGIAYPQINPFMGVMPGLKAFVAAVLGGIGVIPGAMLGSLIMGVVETFTSAYVSSTLRDAVAFGILILVLLVRPAGILGRPTREKV